MNKLIGIILIIVALVITSFLTGSDNNFHSVGAILGGLVATAIFLLGILMFFRK